MPAAGWMCAALLTQHEFLLNQTLRPLVSEHRGGRPARWPFTAVVGTWAVAIRVLRVGLLSAGQGCPEKALVVTMSPPVAVPLLLDSRGFHPEPPTGMEELWLALLPASRWVPCP